MRRFIELRAGQLRWWHNEEDWERGAEPSREHALVDGEARWRLEEVKGRWLRLLCHRTTPHPHEERIELWADDKRDAEDWERAICQHIAYINMLLVWPLPSNGRQGDVRMYGIEFPP